MSGRNDEPLRIETTRVGVGRQGFPWNSGLSQWPAFILHNPDTGMTSVQRANAWATGLTRGANTVYTMTPSVINRQDAPKYVPGAGGFAGHIHGFKPEKRQRKKAKSQL